MKLNTVGIPHKMKLKIILFKSICYDRCQKDYFGLTIYIFNTFLCVDVLQFLSHVSHENKQQQKKNEIFN